MTGETESRRALVLQALCALRCELSDAASIHAYVERRARLLQQLATIADAWNEGERLLLAEVMRQGETTVSGMAARKATVAEKMRALRRSRQASCAGGSGLTNPRRIF